LVYHVPQNVPQYAQRLVAMRLLHPCVVAFSQLNRSRAYARADHPNAGVLFFKLACKPLISLIEVELTRFTKPIESNPKPLINNAFSFLARVRPRGISELLHTRRAPITSP
jgi:hypothetical protein